MYEYIIGVFTGMNKDYVVIESAGIGYRIFTSGSTLSEMPQVNEKVKLYLEQIVREDFLGLYGFLTKDELAMFKLLLTVSGVGAKAALSLLSISKVNNLKYAIIQGEEKVLTKAPGIGKKIAQRIILELKDKINLEDIIQEGVTLDLDIANMSNVVLIENEAMEALVSLGYSQKEAEKAIERVEDKSSLENIIKACLKYLIN